jgi:hypothetical protein
MNKKSIWTNKDGLYVGFGPRAVEVNSAAVIGAGDGQTRTVILKIVGAEVPSAAGAKELANSAVIPAGANIKSVRVVVDSAFTGGTSLDLGGFTLADAADDDDGFIAALLTATLAAGYDETYTAAAANKGGAYLGTKLANTVKVAPSYNTSAFTAGVATVTIEYETPAN